MNRKLLALLVLILVVFGVEEWRLRSQISKLNRQVELEVAGRNRAESRWGEPRWVNNLPVGLYKRKEFKELAFVQAESGKEKPIFAVHCLGEPIAPFVKVVPGEQAVFIWPADGIIIDP